MTQDPDATAADAPDPESLRGLFHAAEVRNYLFAGLAALAMIFVVLFGRGADLGGLLILLTGAGGMVLRRAGVPPLVLLLLLYFQVFPYGLPPPDENPFAIAEGRFGVGDMILAAAVVVYVACHYRVYGLTARAFPAESTTPPRGEQRPPRRTPANVRPDEVTRLVVLAVAAAVAGQVVWWGLTTATIDVVANFPLRFDRPAVGRGQQPGFYGPRTTRVLLLVGLVAGGVMLGRLVFGYWRLRRLSPAEGGLILQEAGWDETRREQVRVAAWRAWGRARRARAAATGPRDKPEGGR